jgi:hypothetical protein
LKNGSASAGKSFIRPAAAQQPGARYQREKGFNFGMSR